MKTSLAEQGAPPASESLFYILLTFVLRFPSNKNAEVDAKPITACCKAFAFSKAKRQVLKSVNLNLFQCSKSVG